MHHQLADALRVDHRDVEDPYGAAVAGERLGGGTLLAGDEIADRATAELRLSGFGGQRGIDARALVCNIRGDDGEELVGGAVEKELQLAVLVDRADRRDRRHAPALLAEAFSPELHVPAGEALQPVAIAKHYVLGDAALFGVGNRDRRADGGRHIAGRGPVEDRLQGACGTAADFLGIETGNDGGDQAYIGERRKASADACIMLQEADIEGLEQLAQLVELAGDRRLAEAQHPVSDLFLHSGVLEGRQQRHRLDQGLARTAGFGDDDRASGLQRKRRKRVGQTIGIQIVEEVQARAIAEVAGNGKMPAAYLSQRLATEAGAACTEDDNVAGPFGEPGGGFGDLGQIVGALGQRQERQRAAFARLAQPDEPGLGSRQYGFVIVARQAGFADLDIETAIDRLLERHCVVLCRESAKYIPAETRATRHGSFL